VSLVPTAVERSPAAERPPRTGTRPAWLIAGCYLLGALAVTVHVWADPAGLMQRGNDKDVNLFAWFLRYAAVAVAHGHLPALVTTALNAPRGVSVMWNTSFLLPGILFTPVTLLAGPQVSLTIVLTLSIAGSAASLFFVLRRWGASLSAAAVGGAVYGFSPALLNSGIGHYHLVLAVLPPLILDALLQIMTGRGNPVRAGAWMGLLTAAQVFIGEEELVFTAVAGVALVAALALGHPRAVRGRAPAAALGVLTAAAAALLVSGYPLWVQFRGPLSQHSKLFGAWSGNLGLFVDPSGDLLFHTPASARIVAAFPLHLPEALSYLGWPLIIVLAAAAIWFWRDPKVRAAAVSFLVLELCSQGGGRLAIRGFRLPGQFLPYHWLQGLPVMAQLIPGRFCLLADGAAGAVLAFSLDRARSLVPRDRGWLSRIPAAAVVLAVLPLIPLPYQTDPVPAVPAGWQQAFARLRLGPDASVLVVPVTLIGHSEVMRWQADTGEPGSMVGGYFLGPGPNGQATFGMGGPQQYAAQYLDRLWSGQTHDTQLARVRSALAYWQPAAVVAVTPQGSVLGHFLIRLLGPPTFAVGTLLVWRR
jgi:hypothetical protein